MLLTKTCNVCVFVVLPHVTNLGQLLYMWSVFILCHTKLSNLNLGKLLTCRPDDLATQRRIHSYVSESNKSGICNSFTAIHQTPTLNEARPPPVPLPPLQVQRCAATPIRGTLLVCGEAAATSIKALPVPPNWIYATFMCRCKFVELRHKRGSC